MEGSIMGARVIEIFDKGFPCRVGDCTLRFGCVLNADTKPDKAKALKPRVEIVVAGTNVTATCHDYHGG